MKNYEKIINHYQNIITIKQIEGVLDWDMNVNVRPGGYQSRGIQNAYLAKLKHSLLTDRKFTYELNEIYSSDEYSNLGGSEKNNLQFIKREVDIELKIPESLVGELAEVTSIATGVWEDSKKTGEDFEYLKYLEKIFYLTSEYIKCKGHDGDPYDALLDDYDRGLKYADVGEKFKELKGDIINLLRHESDSALTYVSNELLTKPVNKSIQALVSREIIKILNINDDFLCLNESTHPFTATLGLRDVRITTNYMENNFTSSIFSTLHEAGHALYELGVQNELGMSPSSEINSLSLHESQSRFYENIIGRSREFIDYFLSHLKNKKIDLFDNITPKAFYQAVNIPSYTPIRIDSDEIYYNLHIILRTEIEHELINGKVKVRDVNELWNDKFYRIFGKHICEKKEGYLQDIHWAGGGIGYFPTYTMGNIIASQFAHQINREIGVLEKEFDCETFRIIGKWFSENLYKYGNSLTSSDLVKKVTGESINPQYLVEHLRRKSRCAG